MEFFDEFEIIGGIVPNLIAFSLILGAIGYFALIVKMAEMFGIRKRQNQISPPSFDRRLLSKTQE